MRRERLLDPSALRRYERLTLHVRRGVGERPGDRRVPGRPQPSGIELETHATYAPGDDLRHLDWNAVARLDTLVMRRFTAERELLFHLLIDVSASMTVPARDEKLPVALELAMALAYVALRANDAVRIALLRADRPAGVSPIYRQRASAVRAADFLTVAEASGALALGDALESYARQHPTPGVALVISDLMMDPAEVERGLRALRARRYEVLLVHVIGRGELDPTREFARAVLRDVESGATHPIVLTPPMLARYQALLDGHLATLEAVAERTGATYARLATDQGVAAFLTGELPRLGLIRRR